MPGFSPQRCMEPNQIKQQIAELAERVNALRGYL
jgi:hypothetical protein